MPSPIPPRVRRGALLRTDVAGSPRWGLGFPLNPSSLTRHVVATGSGRPQQTITFVLPLDASDALEGAEEVANQAGVHPQLAVLERLLVPPDDQGTTLFSWGARAVPVEVAELTIVEELFDRSLAPVRASVEVTLRVLGDADAEGNKAVHGLLASHDRWQQGEAARVSDPGIL